MTEHDDLLYLAHIDEAISRIERSTTLRGRAALDRDQELRDATLFRLQTLAESSQRLSDSFKGSHPEIPWERVAGFRNRIVHGYLDVDVDIVWAIIEHDLPSLANCVRVELALRNERGGLDLGL